MILVDIPRGNKESPQYKNQASLRTYIRSMGILSEHTELKWGDVAFEGNGPDGSMTIGIERKALHDFLNCIDDASYASHQRIGMKSMYKVSFLFIEGMWRSREDGMLLESRDGCQWWVCKPHGHAVTYSKVRRYLISLSYAGVIVNYTRNLWHTAYDICETYHYHQKKWDDHTSLREIHKMALPQLNGKPHLVRKWASDIEGIGVKLSEEAERLFRKPITLATSSEEDWLKLSRVGVSTAQDVIRQIHGINGRG